MKIRLLSWNVRGVNNCDKRKVIKALIKKNRADLVCLQETKIQEMSRATPIIRYLFYVLCYTSYNGWFLSYVNKSL